MKLNKIVEVWNSLLSSKNFATIATWRNHLPTLGCSAWGWQRGFSLLRLSVFLHNEFLSGCVKTQIACVVCLLVKAHSRWFQKIKIKMFMFVCFLIGACYTLNVWSRGKQLNLFEKHQDLRENKTFWFPKRPDIKCFVKFVVFHFNSNKRITGVNQNSWLGTYNNQHNFIILQTTEWMIYLHLFSLQAAVSLLG